MCISYYGTPIVEDYAGYITGVAQDSILSRGKMTPNSGVIREKRQRLGAVRGVSSVLTSGFTVLQTIPTQPV